MIVHTPYMRPTHNMRQAHYASNALSGYVGQRENMRTMQNRPKHYLRAWRKHRGLSIEGAIERAKELLSDRVIAEGEEGDMRRLGLSQPNISRIERGDLPYGQPLLEILAEVYGTDPASLIMRDPGDPEGIWSIMDQVPAAERPRFLKVISGVVDGLKTGTDG